MEYRKTVLLSSPSARLSDELKYKIQKHEHFKQTDVWCFGDNFNITLELASPF